MFWGGLRSNRSRVPMELRSCYEPPEDIHYVPRIDDSEEEILDTFMGGFNDHEDY
jgi:hypothetical protein